MRFRQLYLNVLTVLRVIGHNKPRHVTSPPPYESMDASAIPTSVDWRTAGANGASLVTKDLNQHIPQYCG